jgi:hypothetical protein
MKNWHIADEGRVISGERQALRVIWLAGSSLIRVLLSNDTARRGLLQLFVRVGRATADAKMFGQSRLYISHQQVCFFFAHENLGPQLTLYYSNYKRVSSCVVSQISNNDFSSNWHIRTVQKSLAIYFLRVYCVAPNNLKRRDRSSENRTADSQTMERRARLPLRHPFQAIQ